MSLELEQVRVALTSDADVLSVLKKRRQLRQDSDGEYYPISFNSAEIKFRPNHPLVVGRSVANCLVRSSYIIMGDDLTGDMAPALEALDGFNLGEGLERQDRPKCEICGRDFPTGRALAHHTVKVHSAELSDDPKTASVLPTPPVESPAKAAVVVGK